MIMSADDLTFGPEQNVSTFSSQSTLVWTVMNTEQGYRISDLIKTS